MSKKLMKATKVLLFSSALAMAIPVIASAESNVAITVNHIAVESTGNYLSNEGKTYVDVDAFAKVTGASYKYDEAKNTLSFNGKSVDFVLKDGMRLAYVRSLAEAAGASKVDWEAQTRTVNIQYEPKLTVYGDVVSQLAGCAIQNRFTEGDSIVFRMKAIHPISGQLEQTAKLQVHLSTGEVLDMHFGAHPPDPKVPNPDYFWTAKYEVTKDTPKGTLNYYVTAETPDLKGEYRPFNVMPSLLTIVSADAASAPADTPVEAPASR